MSGTQPVRSALPYDLQISPPLVRRTRGWPCQGHVAAGEFSLNTLPEPGLFLINPQGNVQIVDISNAPFSRPDLQMILHGAKVVIEKNCPVRGTHA